MRAMHLDLAAVAIASGTQLLPLAAQPRANISDRNRAMERSDREIPRPKPVSSNGVRYETVRNARMRGFKQAGGVIAAIDEKSGRELWTLQVYEVTFDRAEERDVQEVFITRLRVGGSGKQLQVTNERKQVFMVDLADRKVTPAAKW